MQIKARFLIFVATCCCLVLISFAWDGSTLWVMKPAVAQGAVNDRVFIKGYVAVPVSTPAEKVKDIALPHASVFLFDQQSPADPIASTVTDLSGRFVLKADKPSLFIVCVEAAGFDSHCVNEINIETAIFRISPIRLPRKRDSNREFATLFGNVTLGDGSRARGFAPLQDVNAYPRVEMKAGSGIEYEGFVNNFGEYIVPSVPVKGDFIFRVSIEDETQERSSNTDSTLLPNVDHRMDVQLANRPPKVHLVSAGIGGKRQQVVPPGSTVTLTAVASDLDEDKLFYRWALSDGTVVAPDSNSTFDWTLPTRRGSYTATVIVSDDRGGYTRNSVTLQAGNNRVTFSGVVVDVNDKPIGQAQIDVNGRIIPSDGEGRFELQVPVADRYVLNIRKSDFQQPNAPVYGTLSYVYTGAIAGGRWVMRHAQVFTVDPKQPIALQHKRSKQDCSRPKSAQINWQLYMNEGILQWQDGRGYPRSMPEIGRTDPEAINRMMPLLSRIDRRLSRELGKITKAQSFGDDNELPCLDGIGVLIPANALVDRRTGAEPVGDVKIALSTVSLSMPQMPGDYSADDGSGAPLSMESFGAGSVEIGSGSARFNLKSGMEAEVSIPVDATQVVGGASLKSEIPFLYYNEQKGIWEQDGVAELSGSGTGAVYRKKVAHFSTMNADILKSGQSCVAVELDPAAGFVLPLEVEVTLQPSVVNPNVIQVRTLSVDSQKSNAIYNLPNMSDIVLTPIVQGVQADGSTGPVPAGVFVVNTGGPQTSGGNVPTPNPDGTYYSEVSGQPAGPCASRVTLTFLNGPVPAAGYEFLQGLSFQSSNITEFALIDQNISDNIVQGAVDYYNQVDPRDKRANFNLFKSENKFGEPLNAALGEVEHTAQFANSGDLGFGRDMHCRRNRADDNQFDLACFVTNYGQPPANFADQVDADNAFNNINPNATVAMEYSRVENALGDPIEYPDNDRAVKFFVYDTNNPDGPPVTQADLDGFGDRPIPQLCMVCHGGQLASIAADPADPTGPKKGAFADRLDIMSMNSSFLPFDLRLYNFPALNSKAAQQAAFKGLNEDIVEEVALANGIHGTAIEEMIDAFYFGGSATQLEDAVIANWDGGNPASDSNKFYRDVFAPTCRTCHISRPFGAPNFTNKVDFHNLITNIQNRVCAQRIMPHAKRTNDIFWTSLGPNMPAFFELYGQTLPGWSASPSSQCGLDYQGGGAIPISEFSTEVYPILVTNCSNAGCHGNIGNANFAIGNELDTYNDLLNDTAKDGVSKYIAPNSLGSSLLYQRLLANPSPRMPLGGSDLTALDTDAPADGLIDADEIANWINAGASGP